MDLQGFQHKVDLHGVSTQGDRLALTRKPTVRTQVIFVEQTVVLYRAFLRVLQYFPVNIVPPEIYNYSIIIGGCGRGPFAAPGTKNT